MGDVTFVGTCVQLSAADLDDFDDSVRQITNRTFRKHLGPDLYREFEACLGYGREIGLWLSRDYCVSYHKGRWKGKPAICCMWSSIHHIWLIGVQNG
jgi:hypothetical protein